jgi:predicted MPP superfamily phosphohydrolase
MFVAAIFVLSLLLMWADWVAWRRFLRPMACVWGRRIAGVGLILANLLPYVAVAVMWLDNTSAMVPTMWLLTAYTILSLSRLALYAGLLTFKNRYTKWGIGTTLSTIVAVVLLVGVVHTRKALKVESVKISSARLPESFDGYRIAFFSDLHIGSMTSAEQMCRNLVDAINALDADLVVFGGDLVNARYDELTPVLQTILGDINARDGVVAVLGNHDTGVYVRDTVALPIVENTRLLKARIEDMGWRVVDDGTEELVRDNDTITLTGIGFSRELLDHRHSAEVADSLDLRPIYKGLPSDKFNITVSHMPQLWRKVYTLGYGDLVLSGHVHSMQMKLALGKWRFSPAQLMYGEWSGHYEENGSHLYITDGVGSVGFHLRIGAPPEITCLTLHRRR